MVTGAASGIGFAMAQRFAEEGMRVVLADIENESLALSCSELAAKGHEAASYRIDVSRPEDVKGLADFAFGRYGSVQVLCNNAGVGMGGVVWEHSPEDWAWLLGVNVIGVVNGIREFVPRMLGQGDDCHIVNTASAAGLDARPWLGMYSATKYAVVAISEALEAELRMRGSKIGVSVLCPAVVNTRIGESERNRPEGTSAGPKELSADAQAFETAFRAALAQGLPASRVADLVLEGMKQGRLYITTNAETEARVRDRLGRVLADVSALVT